MAKSCPAADTILERCKSTQKKRNLSSCFVYVIVNHCGTLQANFQGIQAEVAHEEELYFIIHVVMYTAVYIDLGGPSCLLTCAVSRAADRLALSLGETLPISLGLDLKPLTRL